MRQALRIAKQALPDDVPVGALVLNEKGEFLASAHNQREQMNLLSAHAEILALDRAAKLLHNWRLEQCSLYVTLQPCAMCQAAIEQSRIARVIFGAYEREQELSLPGSFIGGILEGECSKLLKDFFRGLRAE